MSSSEKEKHELKEQLRLLRGDMSEDLENLGGRLNVVQRFQNSFVENQKKWLIGGLVVGTILAFSSSRRSFTKKAPTGSESLVKNLFLGLLGMATKQILKQAAPSIAKLLQSEIEQRTTVRAKGAPSVKQPRQNENEHS